MAFHPRSRLSPFGPEGKPTAHVVKIKHGAHTSPRLRSGKVFSPLNFCFLLPLKRQLPPTLLPFAALHVSAMTGLCMRWVHNFCGTTFRLMIFCSRARSLCSSPLPLASLSLPSGRAAFFSIRQLDLAVSTKIAWSQVESDLPIFVCGSISTTLTVSSLKVLRQLESMSKPHKRSESASSCIWPCAVVNLRLSISSGGGMFYWHFRSAERRRFDHCWSQCSLVLC